MGITRDEVRQKVAELLGEEDPEMEAELVESFLHELPPLRQTIAAADQAGDPESLNRAAHTLKSQAAVIGADQLSEASRAVEHAAQEGAVDGALVAALLAEAEAVEADLRAFA